MVQSRALLYVRDDVLAEFPNLDSSSRWWLIIAAVLTIVYAVMRPMRKKKDPLSRPAPSSTLSNQRAVEREMNNLLVELSDMARQITAQLDTRTLKLETLIKEADDRIAALKAAAHKPADRPTGGVQEAQDPALVDEPEPAIDPRHVQVYELADAGRSTQDIAVRLNRPRGEIELILALRHQPAGA